MIERNTVWCLDWLDLMQKIDSNSIDLIFIDPPYNVTNLAFEAAIDWSRFWTEARRVLKYPKSPTLSFSQQPFTTDLINSNRAGFRYEIIMEKSMPTGFLDANRRPLRCHENILLFADAAPDYWPVMEHEQDLRARVISRGGNRAPHYNNHTRQDGWRDTGQRYPRDVWHVAQRDSSFRHTKTWHQTQKPMDAVEKALRLYSQPGWLIVDCFAGSGTLAVAARALHRDYILGDNDPAMIAICHERLRLPFEAHHIQPNNDLSDLPLFTQEPDV